MRCACFHINWCRLGHAVEAESCCSGVCLSVDAGAEADLVEVGQGVDGLLGGDVVVVLAGRDGVDFCIWLIRNMRVRLLWRSTWPNGWLYLDLV